MIQSAEDLLIHLGVHAVAHVDVAVSDALGEARARSDSAHQPKIARHVVESNQQILLRHREMNRIRLKRVRSHLGGTWIGACRVCPSLEIAGRVVRSPHGYCIALNLLWMFGMNGGAHHL